MLEIPHTRAALARRRHQRTLPCPHWGQDASAPRPRARRAQVNASEMSSGRFYDTDLVLISNEKFDGDDYDDDGQLRDQARP